MKKLLVLALIVLMVAACHSVKHPGPVTSKVKSQKNHHKNSRLHSSGMPVTVVKKRK